MRSEALPRIVLSRSNHVLLEALIENGGSGDDELDRLSHELARAEVLPDEEVPGGVVLLGSRVTFRDVDSGALRTVQLVLPREADPAQGRISVLAPMGCALLGLRAGQRIAWPVPGGRQRRIEVVEVAAP